MVYLGRISLKLFYRKRVRKSRGVVGKRENLRNRAEKFRFGFTIRIVVVGRVETQGGRLNEQKASRKDMVFMKKMNEDFGTPLLDTEVILDSRS